MVDKKTLALGATLVVLVAGVGLRLHSLRRAASPAPGSQAPAGPCAHDGPRPRCFVCDPTLVDALGPCVEHGVPEAKCTRCSPALIPIFKKIADWCAEHGLPESQCVTCHPALAAPTAPPAAPPSPDERLRGAPRAGCRKEGQRIELASAELVAQVGLEATPVVRAPFRDLVTAPAEVVHRSDRRAVLSSRAAGVVREVRAELGQWVEAGAVVALVDSPELDRARAELTAADAVLALRERSHARELELAEAGVGSRRTVVDAETRRAEAAIEVRSAELRLRALGFTPEQVVEARAGAAPAWALTIRAPFAGAVVARDAVPGQVVGAGERLAAIVDTRTVWALVQLPDEVGARARLGAPIVFTTPALRGEQFAGRVTWIATELDRRTRTLAARAELDNADGRLKANAFGAAEVGLGEGRDALLVPLEAVQWEGCCNVVFLPAGDRAFVTRKVVLGGATGTHVEVLRGLAAGDAVVSVGAFLLKTELLKGSIGAGCCEAD